MAGLDGMALYVRVVDLGSLSAAARSLGLPKSTVSRRLTMLEASLGTPLLRRSTRALSLTDAGRTYLERVRPIVREAEAAELEIRSRSARPVGLVRLSATTTFGQVIVAPIIWQLMKREPGLRFDLRLTDRRLDLFEENLDIAIRMGGLDDTELVARKLCTASRVLVAAPEYLAGRKPLLEPRDLDVNDCIVTAAEHAHWAFADGQELRVPWRFSSGTVAMAIEAAIAGRGIALVPRFCVAHALDAGRLVMVLDKHPLPPAQATALFPRDRVPSIASKTVIDALVSELSKKNV